MKRSLYLVGALVLITAVTLFSYFRKSSSSTLDPEGKNFSFKDTAQITKIFLADKEGNSSTLERTPKGWIVNGKFRCRTDAILSLMESIKHVDVKMSVIREQRDLVIRQLASGAVKVEIWTGDEIARQYYVGYEANDGEGSYMLLSDPETGKNHSEPYICWIPGFIGFLQPRYIARENDWRDRVVVNYTPPQMRKVEVQFTDAMKDSSFTILLAGTTSFKLKDAKGNEVEFDEGQMRQYLAYMQNLSYEGLITGRNKRLQDSLTASGPFCVLRVTTNLNNNEEYRFYRKAFLGRNNPDIDFKYDFDPDRLFMSFDGNRQWALAQYYTFGKLLVGINYFAPRTAVKK